MKQVGKRILGVFAIALTCGVGCTETDLYAPCDLDPNSASQQTRVCAQEGTEFSCVISNYLQCETRHCAKFEGSETFCTQPCTADADCAPGGECIEFVIQSGQRYCVEQ